MNCIAKKCVQVGTPSISGIHWTDFQILVLKDYAKTLMIIIIIKIPHFETYGDIQKGYPLQKYSNHSSEGSPCSFISYSSGTQTRGLQPPSSCKGQLPLRDRERKMQ